MPPSAHRNYLPGLLRQIEHDAALVAVGSQIHGGQVLILTRAQIPCGVTGRRLDLDYIGTHVAQYLGRDRTKQYRC